MKAKELRIGNYHETDCFSHPRMGISPIKINDKCFSAITSYGIHLVDEGKLDFKPIPLTEEWLVKFGFKKLRDELYTQNNIEVWHKDSGFYHTEMNVGLNLDYVHQLQNLYFALTGEELKS